MNPRDIQWYYINLTSRPDRRRHAKEEFARAKLPVQRFEAFTPDQWTGDPAKVAHLLAGRTPGALGCYHSQTEVIRTVVDSDRIVAVCEDDVCFCKDFQRRLAYIAKYLTWDWDIFYFGATFHAGPGEWHKHPDCRDWGPRMGCDAETTRDKHFMRVYGEWGTYAYLVNGRNARKVLDLFDANVHRSRGIDHLAIILGDKLNAFCFVPGCCWQYDSETNIGTPGQVTRFSKFKYLGPYVWTERMEDFDPDGYDWEKGAPRVSEE